jgi:hypothetical protein
VTRRDTGPQVFEKKILVHSLGKISENTRSHPREFLAFASGQVVHHQMTKTYPYSISKMRTWPAFGAGWFKGILDLKGN